MNWLESIQRNTILTVGDGLGPRFPRSMSTGSACSSRWTLLSHLVRLREQISRKPAAILIAGIMIAVFGLIPGLPKMPFFLVALVTAGYAVILIRENAAIERTRAIEAAPSKEAPKERIEDLLTVDILGVEIGYGLITIVDESRAAISSTGSHLRRKIAQEMGIIVPPVLSATTSARPNDYTISYAATSGEARSNGHVPCHESGFADEEIEGKTRWSRRLSYAPSGSGRRPRAPGTCGLSVVKRRA